MNKTIVDASHIQLGPSSMFEDSTEEEDNNNNNNNNNNNEKKENCNDYEVTPLSTCEPTLCDTPSSSTNRRSESPKKATTSAKRTAKKRTHHQRVSTETAESSGAIQEAPSTPLMMKKAKKPRLVGGGCSGGGGGAGGSSCHKYETLRVRYHHLLHDFHHLRSRYEKNVPESCRTLITCSECGIPLTCHQCGHSKEEPERLGEGVVKEEVSGGGVRVIILR